MKAAETKVDRFLGSNETAFAIPVYQRNYDWAKTQCAQLFKDILAVGADETNRAISSAVSFTSMMTCMLSLPCKNSRSSMANSA